MLLKAADETLISLRDGDVTARAINRSRGSMTFPDSASSVASRQFLQYADGKTSTNDMSVHSCCGDIKRHEDFTILIRTVRLLFKRIALW
jgi:hypothetical protein